MTEIYFCFDTEDFTQPLAWEASKQEAQLLEKHGIKGNFNVVGYLAREWMKNGRYDVPAALLKHNIGFHSLRHSYHPTICEYTDLESYDEARALLLKYENEGLGMVKAATGLDHFDFACPPGSSLSYVAMYEYAEMDMPVYLGSVFTFKDGKSTWMCNAVHTNYDYYLENLFIKGGIFDVTNYETKSFLDHIAGRKRVFLATHPTRAYFDDFWDIVNYNGSNKHEMYQWETPPRNSEADTAKFFAEFEKLILALKADDRFVIRDVKYLADKARKDMTSRVVTFDQLPEIKRQLQENFFFVTLPGVTLSLTDCFAAAAHFTASREPFKPGFVRGFLSSPVGVTAPVSLWADEVKALAASYKPDTFLKPCYAIHGKVVGPADLLFAMLDVAMGAESVTLTPRPQLPELTGDYKPLQKFNLRGKHWIHRPDFEDNYISNRLRLQSWTIRDEI